MEPGERTKPTQSVDTKVTLPATGRQSGEDRKGKPRHRNSQGNASKCYTIDANGRPVEELERLKCFYLRLEELSKSPTSGTAIDSCRLADEATDFVLKHKMKGYRVGALARELAVALQSIEDSSPCSPKAHHENNNQPDDHRSAFRARSNQCRLQPVPTNGTRRFGVPVRGEPTRLELRLLHDLRLLDLPVASSFSLSFNVF